MMQTPSGVLTGPARASLEPGAEGSDRVRTADQCGRGRNAGRFGGLRANSVRNGRGRNPGTEADWSEFRDEQSRDETTGPRAAGGLAGSKTLEHLAGEGEGETRR